MFNQITRRQALTTGLAVSLTAPLLTSNSYAEKISHGEKDDFLKAIKVQYAFYEKSFAKKSTKDFVQKFYSDDIYITGEGEGAWSGKREVLELIKILMAQTQTVTVKQINTVQVSPDLGYDFVLNSILPEGIKQEVIEYKSLLIWRRIDNHWKCSADFYAMGKF